jgi:mannosyltransferase OCH1-like enzyme
MRLQKQQQQQKQLSRPLNLQSQQQLDRRILQLWQQRQLVIPGYLTRSLQMMQLKLPTQQLHWLQTRQQLGML